MLSYIMICGFSFIDKVQEEKMLDLLGKPYTLFEKLSLAGTGSPPMQVLEASEPIAGLLNKNSDIKKCNIELRRQGIILGFQSKQEPYGWIVPYRLLSIFKTGNNLSIHANGMVVKLGPHLSESIDKKFLQKLMDFKSNYLASTRGPQDPSF